MDFTIEQIAKAKKASSAEELYSMAKEDGIDVTLAEVKEYYSQFHKSNELSDEDLSQVTGGSGVISVNTSRFELHDRAYWLVMDTWCEICRITTIHNGKCLYDIKTIGPGATGKTYDRVSGESLFTEWEAEWKFGVYWREY